MEGLMQPDAAGIIAEAYTTGDFSGLYRHMSSDYTHISFWVMEVLRGEHTLREYYEAKGTAMRASSSFPAYRIVKILRAPDSVRPKGVFRGGNRVEDAPEFLNREDTGKHAVLFEQEVRGEKVTTLHIPSVNGDGEICQNLVTNPELYDFIAVEFLH